MIKESDVIKAFELAKQQQQSSYFSSFKARQLKAGADRLYEKWRNNNKGKTIKFK